MQLSVFHTGGFVAHKVTVGRCKRHVSAWFDASGRLLDAEYVDPCGRTRPVLRGRAVWKLVTKLGPRLWERVQECLDQE